MTAALPALCLTWLGVAALLAVVGSRHRIVGPRYEVEAIAAANERRHIRMGAAVPSEPSGEPRASSS